MTTPSVEVDQVYRHYKGGYYIIVGVATHTETGETLVVYKAICGHEHRLWCRPLSIFLSPVANSVVDRFTLLDESCVKELSCDALL